MTYRELWQSLTSRYTEPEAKAVARYLLEVGYGLSMTDILSGGAERLPADEMEENRRRLLNGEPVQYVIGKAEFGGRIFKVSPAVLVPRPETYELCQWVEEEESGKRREERDYSLLDIGTGSGCIAITLALDMPYAKVEAWDISEKALNIARQNAESLNAQVHFRQVDALNEPTEDSSLFTLHSSLNIIISNPPYICKQEATAMEAHVLDHEPHQALFVPDNDPLLFYRAIAQYGKSALVAGGWLYFEINPLYHEVLEKMLDEMGYFGIETRKDQFGQWRFARAQRP
jgi:release factor glutamine methyltransferase